MMNSHPQTEALHQTQLATPIGALSIVFDAAGRLHAAGFHLAPRFANADAPEALRERLLAYFAGDFQSLAHIPLSLQGTTFQREVWSALRTIPPGETRSYRDIAQQIGKPKAMRAVGLANASNPINLMVPCHRVVGADGSLTGYAGGIERKRWLLEHERKTVGAESDIVAAWRTPHGLAKTVASQWRS